MRFLVSEKLGPHKYKTPEGYLICTDAILSRTGKQEYRRSELFGDACDEPDKIVNVDRLDDDVFSDKALASFENKPICLEHPDENVTTDNYNDLAVGFVRDVYKGEYNGQPVMRATLVITDKDAIADVESGKYCELSCGYDCDIQDENAPKQTNIRGNHVALCEQGRAGIARIIDSVTDVGRKVWQVHQGYAIVVAKYWELYKTNAFVDVVESSLDGARFRRNSLERADGMSFVIIDCNDGRHALVDSMTDATKYVDAIDLKAGMKINYRGVVYEVLDVKKSFYPGSLDVRVKSKTGQIILETGERNTFAIVDKEMKMNDIVVTKKPGADKILYVMQSDGDKNLYFYIGKTFAMKEGSWGYTKFEMGDTNPVVLKNELTKNGWHQVSSGPAKVIDEDTKISDAMHQVVLKLNAGQQMLANVYYTILKANGKLEHEHTMENNIPMMKSYTFSKTMTNISKRSSREIADEIISEHLEQITADTLAGLNSGKIKYGHESYFKDIEKLGYKFNKFVRVGYMGLRYGDYERVSLTIDGKSIFISTRKLNKLGFTDEIDNNYEHDVQDINDSDKTANKVKALTNYVNGITPMSNSDELKARTKIESEIETLEGMLLDEYRAILEKNKGITQKVNKISFRGSMRQFAGYMADLKRSLQNAAKRVAGKNSSLANCLTQQYKELVLFCNSRFDDTLTKYVRPIINAIKAVSKVRKTNDAKNYSRSEMSGVSSKFVNGGSTHHDLLYAYREFSMQWDTAQKKWRIYATKNGKTVHTIPDGMHPGVELKRLVEEWYKSKPAFVKPYLDLSQDYPTRLEWRSILLKKISMDEFGKYFEFAEDDDAIAFSSKIPTEVLNRAKQAIQNALGNDWVIAQKSTEFRLVKHK